MSICSSRTIALSAAGSSGSSAGTSGGPCISGDGLLPAPLSLPATTSPLPLLGCGSSAAVPPSANFDTHTGTHVEPTSRQTRLTGSPSETLLIASSFVRMGFDLYVGLSGSYLGSALIHPLRHARDG